MKKVLEALGTDKYGEETWSDIFARANKEGGIDQKTIIKVLVAILEELDAKSESTKSTTPERYEPTTLPDWEITSTADNLGAAVIDGEDTELLSGTGDIEEEAPSGTGDKGNND